MKIYFFNAVVVIFSIGAFSACSKLAPAAPEENTLLDGPVEGLNAQEQLQFLHGDEAFGETFTVAKGLGPVFVATQCASCHPGDGKGTPFVEFIRFGQNDATGNKFLDQGGPQLQQKAIPGFEPETLPDGAPFTSLIAPAVTGLGFVDAVSDADILANEDPMDLDGDGISGRAHWNNVPDYVMLRPNTISKDGKYISRFGKKAAAYDLLHQTSAAYNQDMGITSLFEPIDAFSGLEVDPEISTQTLNDVVFYLKTLKAPIRRNIDDPEVMQGENIFSAIECAKCHTPSFTTASSPIASLSNVEFYPYSDMLLHDMGEALDDGYTEGFATTAEWRTPMLWGLGLSPDAQGGQYHLLHDGRAKSITEAIEFHGGEAQNSKEAFVALSSTDKKALIKFLESL